MKTEVRRKDRAVSREQALDVLSRAEYGVLSMIDDGRPYGVPLSFCVMDGGVYFHCALEGRKINALAASPEVGFCAVCDTQPYVRGGGFSTEYASAMVFGRAVRVEDEEEKRRSLIALCEKYAPGHGEEAVLAAGKAAGVTAVYRVDISEISGKANKRK